MHWMKEIQPFVVYSLRTDRDFGKNQTSDMENEYFRKAIVREGSVADQYVGKVAQRAEANLKEFYRLLRQVGLEGTEELISAIRAPSPQPIAIPITITQQALSSTASGYSVN